MASLNKASLASSMRTVREVAQSHRTRRILVGLLIFVVVFGLLGFFAAPPLIRHIASQQLSKQLDRPASIGRIALNPYTLRLEADNVHIGERGGAGDFVDISRLIVQPSWSSLFRGAPIVDEVHVDSPRFHLVRYDAQHFNFSDLIEKFANQPSKPNSKPTQFSVSNIRVENGQITFDDRLLGTRHVIDQWMLGIPFIATLPSKTDIFVEPLLRARIDGDSQLAIDGRTKPFAASRESEVSLRFDDLDVPKLVSYAPTKLPVIVQSGKLSTDLKLNFVMTNDTPLLRVAGTVDLNEVNVQDQGKAPFFAARAVHVAAASLEPLKSVYHFDEIRINAPSASLARDKDGVLSVEHMFASAPEKTAAKETADANANANAKTAAEKAAPPFDVAIKRFTLDDGTVNLRDEAAARPVETGLQNLAVTLTDFSTLASTPAHYTLNTNLKDGAGSLAADGTVGLAAKTASAKLDLKSLKLPPWQPYLDTATSAQALDGKLSATTNIDANWSKSPMALTVADTQLDMQALKLAARGDKTPVISLAQGTVVVKQVDVAARTAEVTSVDATGLAIDAQRLKDGSINLNALAGTHQEATQRTAIHAAKKAQAEGPAWRYRIGELTLKDASADFTDNTLPQPVKLSFTPVQLKVRQISDDLSLALPVDLQATLNKKGTLAVKGDVTATPLKLAVKINANQLDAAAFEPYFGGNLNATLASALLNANGDLSVIQGKSLKANYRGDMALVAVRMIDKLTSAPFAGWGSFALTNLKADYDEHGTVVDASRVTFSKFYGRVLLDAQGKLNLKDLVAHESEGHPIPLTPEAVSEAVAASAPKAASAASPGTAPRPVATATAATPPKSPLKLHFGQLVLQQGRVTYTDNFIKPNYTANLVDIQGTIGAFGTESTTPAPVDVAAKLAANGPLTIRGTVNPLIAKPALDLTATAHDIELTNLTPYSAKYAGYPITKGKLNVDLHYKLDNDQLDANNHLFIDQLTFGDHIDNDTATKLPVRFAISLLKNSRGEIDVNLPVSGSLSNPEFSIGGLIWHAVLNLLEKAVTAPFTLIAHAFGGKGEELGYVEFEAGSATLTDADKQKLDTIVKALADKPSIRMDLIGRVDPKVDEPALRSQYVDQMVKRQKIKDMVGNGESVDVSTVKVDQQDYDKYLNKAYKSADFKKPRNFIGMTKTLPDDDMKGALAANAPIDEASLRQLAQQRAQSVQQYLEGKIDSSRVFIVAPKMNADDIKDKGATTRVDFGLK
ncbi:DUF748 domain-containing protein [Paraburkholderia sp. MMS20-SJTN17]|uniref:DUF748 domain-containing protein n=1 Tax=Paraburkholderia translucens TaxID=2886945 RepID=A0ABS8KMD0_9BURK|nr:DUF748 domain-containing protein [Paraburkholderia sp. MMS20-SJTN17]MCC8405904.1 DUF748 domain-containing protein [Paraburkholderia sp. MMS20-SJTN17]